MMQESTSAKMVSQTTITVSSVQRATTARKAPKKPSFALLVTIAKIRKLFCLSHATQGHSCLPMDTSQIPVMPARLVTTAKLVQQPQQSAQLASSAARIAKITLDQRAPKVNSQEPSRSAVRVTAEHALKVTTAKRGLSSRYLAHRVPIGKQQEARSWEIAQTVLLSEFALTSATSTRLRHRSLVRLARLALLAPKHSMNMSVPQAPTQTGQEASRTKLIQVNASHARPALHALREPIR